MEPDWKPESPSDVSCMTLLKTTSKQHRAQIFEYVGIKFYYIFHCIKSLKRNVAYFAINLPWKVFEFQNGGI